MSSSSLIGNFGIVADLSHWNGPYTAQDFEDAQTHGALRGVILKLMQDGEVDSAAIGHLQAAKSAGIPLLGFYDFATADDDTRAFVGEVSKLLGVHPTELLVLDSEQAGGGSVESAADWVEAIEEQEGRFPVLYMGRSGPDGKGRGLPNTTLAKCDLWLPAYGPHEHDLGSILPPGFRLPQGDRDHGGCVRLWQFTDGHTNGAAIPGLGHVDQSYPIGFSNLAAFSIWWHGGLR